jgi:hypothetical protein
MNLLEKIIDTIACELGCETIESLSKRISALEKQVAILIQPPRSGVMVITIGTPVQK